jgi:integrase
MKTTTCLTYTPCGHLARIIAEYIVFKRSQGLKYGIEEHILYRFSVLSQRYSIRDKHIPPELIGEWFKPGPNEKATSHYSRCLCIKNFLLYAKKFEYRVEIPELPKRREAHYVPYIFTGKEITAFFNACDAIPLYAGSYRHLILPVVFRLLYCCGLRVSEVVALKIKDVWLDKAILTIREPKNRADRYVPMSSSLALIMRRFSVRFSHASLSGEDFFFSSKYNDHLSRHQIYQWFRICLDKAGIAHRGRGFGPREHDLRHTFCVHSLKALCLQGLDMYCILPYLSAYVGHKSIQATQYYLRLTAEAYPDLIERIANTCGFMIPEPGEALI